jgi:hypothetical protein
MKRFQRVRQRLVRARDTALLFVATFACLVALLVAGGRIQA